MIFSRICSPNNLWQLTHFKGLKNAQLRKSYSSTISARSTTTNDGENSSNEQSTWNKNNFWKYALYSYTALTISGLGFAVSTWGAPAKDENGKELKDQYSDMNVLYAYAARTLKELLVFKDSIRDPISDKLLPDPVEPPYFQPKYTLVIEAKDLLVHPDWKLRTGWRYKKRPALEMFLQQLYPYFEVVCYTSEPSLSMAPVLQQLDPKGELIHYRLFREATRYREGIHFKDLSCLNRDLSKVIMVDISKEAVDLQPDNALILSPWKGDDADRDLIDLAAFLRMIAMSGVDDVRPALNNYMKHKDPLALFRERHQMLMEKEAEKKRSVQEKQQSPFQRFSFTHYR
ncbi:Mitochondrial import inner membrane translocase subunit TIM50 [Cichlidogyrus casuarinus]|uniref:Mitochondrial import inner membrane translocase subunit TIM50 n=1 Tax=Cichlidogyrus casuarinus TaxID=1844966 RepID=A0ABD2QJW5_9PLAT